MLKVGGLMVYSTCAFNPIENEAVVAQLLRASNQRTEGEGGGGGGYRLTLVDASDRLPGLRRSAGLRSWRLMDATGAEVEVDEEIRQGRHARYLPSMLPPSTAEAEQLHLERCMRILPHHQDTGASSSPCCTSKQRTPLRRRILRCRTTDSPTTSEVGQKAPASDATVANQYPRGAVQSNPVDAGAPRHQRPLSSPPPPPPPRSLPPSPLRRLRPPRVAVVDCCTLASLTPATARTPSSP